MYSITKQCQTTDPSPSSLVLNNFNITDVVDTTGKMPFDDLLSEEEKIQFGGDNYTEKADIVAGLMSFLFKPLKGSFIPSPREVALRLYIIAYTVNPSLIGNMTLSEMGELFGTSKQTMSARLVKNSKSLNIRSRAQKGSEVVRKYSDIGKERWRLKKEEDRRKYLKQYRENNRERLRELNKEYYRKNRDRILKARKRSTT